MNTLAIIAISFLTACDRAPNQPAAAPPPAAPAPAAPAAPPAQPEVRQAPGIMEVYFPTGLYDETVNAGVVIKDARIRAKKENTKVLLIFGENLCGFCVYLEEQLKQHPQLRRAMAEYEVVHVNIGKFDRNIELAQYYGLDLMTAGAPSLSIVDPNSDKWTAVQGGKEILAKPMTAAKVFEPDVIFPFLWNNRPQAKPANDFLNAGLAAAKMSERLALLEFTAPVCEECAPVDEWLRKPEVSSVLEKQFEIVKIDIERSLGAKNIVGKYTGNKDSLPPFVAFVKADGESLGNDAAFTAMPKTDQQIAAFLAALKKYAPKLTDSDREAIGASLAEARKPKPPPLYTYPHDEKFNSKPKPGADAPATTPPAGGGGK